MKQHPLCTDPDSGPTIMDLPIAEGLKTEWAELETRRHFLGKAGKVLGWAQTSLGRGEDDNGRLVHEITCPSVNLLYLGSAVLWNVQKVTIH